MSESINAFLRYSFLALLLCNPVANAQQQGKDEYSQYQHTPKGCVNGENIKLYKDKSVAECIELCDITANCVGFEYGVSYGGGGSYKPRDCQPQSSSNTANCNGAHHNLDFYKKKTHYQHTPKGCVNGENIKLYKDKSVAECIDLCDITANCVGFEYGVSYGGGGSYKPRDCQPQSSSNTANCNGAYHNLDFYTKSAQKRCRTERLLLEIDVTTGNNGNENTVSVRRKGKDGWARKALHHKDFEDNVMKKLTHCLHPDKCYKIVIKDKGGDGMSDGDGSYVIKVDGDVIKDSEFVTGKKEEMLFNC